MRTYEASFKVEAVKLASEVGTTRAAKELGIPIGTLDTWVSKAKSGELLDGTSSPKRALTMAEEMRRLRQENRELRRTNEILRKAAAFFAQSQKK